LCLHNASHGLSAIAEFLVLRIMLLNDMITVFCFPGPVREIDKVNFLYRRQCFCVTMNLTLLMVWLFCALCSQETAGRNNGQRRAYRTRSDASRRRPTTVTMPSRWTSTAVRDVAQRWTQHWRRRAPYYTHSVSCALFVAFNHTAIANVRYYHLSSTSQFHFFISNLK